MSASLNHYETQFRGWKDTVRQRNVQTDAAVRPSRRTSCFWRKWLGKHVITVLTFVFQEKGQLIRQKYDIVVKGLHTSTIINFRLHFSSLWQKIYQREEHNRQEAMRHQNPEEGQEDEETSKARRIRQMKRKNKQCLKLDNMCVYHSMSKED